MSQTFFFFGGGGGGGGQRHATLGKLIIMGFKMKIRVLGTLKYRKVDLILTNSVLKRNVFTT